MNLRYTLDSLKATERLGKAMAMAAMNENPGAILLFGDLGAGKTTLTRFLVENLPGGKEAEVSSPSFTICNIYSTKPEVHHYDLYRQEYGWPDESLAESLDAGRVLTLVEWAERLSPRDMPADGVVCHLEETQNPEGEKSAAAPTGPESASGAEKPLETGAASEIRDTMFTPLGPKGESFLGIVASLL